MNLRYAKNTDEEIKRLQKLYGLVTMMFRNALIDTIKGQRLIVAEEDNLVQGFLQISAKRDKILMLVIDPLHRREGIGEKLFNFAKQVYGLRDIKILAIPLSIPFWQRMGFKETGKTHQTKRLLLTEMIY